MKGISSFDLYFIFKNGLIKQRNEQVVNRDSDLEDIINIICLEEVLTSLRPDCGYQRGWRRLCGRLPRPICSGRLYNCLGVIKKAFSAFLLIHYPYFSLLKFPLCALCPQDVGVSGVVRTK